MKFSEKDIQDYIWENRAYWDDLILDLPEISFFDLTVENHNVSPDKIFYNLVVNNLQDLHCKASCADIFASETPLSKEGANTMRVDLLCTFLDDTSIGIIELKKSKQTERQAFTELLAYSNYFTTLFPGSTKSDVFLILIAPMESQIVKEALIQCLLFDKRPIVAFIPTFEDENKLSSLRLKPWIPLSTDVAAFTHTSFNERNLSVCKVVWEYSEGVWDASKGKNPEDYMVHSLNHVSALAAQIMEKNGIHGFAYCSQAWAELAEVYPFTNSLVLVGVNPYAVASANYLAKTSAESSDSAYRLPCLENIFPSLTHSKRYSGDEYDRLDSLNSVWDSNLFRVAKEVVDLSVMVVDGSNPSTDQGFMSWEDCQREMVEDVFCHNFSVRTTGIFRDLYCEVTKNDYSFSATSGAENHPILGDLCHLSIGTLTSQSFFRIFLKRMFYVGDKATASGLGR
jgi:hypothetical protein